MKIGKWLWSLLLPVIGIVCALSIGLKIPSVSAQAADDGAIYLEKGATFTMSGGTISQTDGTSVYIDSTSVFNLNGGTISGDIYVGGTFNYSGGTFSSATIASGKYITFKANLTSSVTLNLESRSVGTRIAQVPNTSFSLSRISANLSSDTELKIVSASGQYWIEIAQSKPEVTIRVSGPGHLEYSGQTTTSTTLTVEKGTTVSVSGNVLTINGVAYTAVPEELAGYVVTFNSWTLDGTTISSVASRTINSSCTIQARFAQQRGIRVDIKLNYGYANPAEEAIGTSAFNSYRFTQVAGSQVSFILNPDAGVRILPFGNNLSNLISSTSSVATLLGDSSHALIKFKLFDEMEDFLRTPKYNETRFNSLRDIVIDSFFWERTILLTDGNEQVTYFSASQYGADTSNMPDVSGIASIRFELLLLPFTSEIMQNVMGKTVLDGVAGRNISDLINALYSEVNFGEIVYQFLGGEYDRIKEEYHEPVRLLVEESYVLSDKEKLMVALYASGPSTIPSWLVNTRTGYMFSYENIIRNGANQFDEMCDSGRIEVMTFTNFNQTLDEFLTATGADFYDFLFSNRIFYYLDENGYPTLQGNNYLSGIYEDDRIFLDYLRTFTTGTRQGFADNNEYGLSGIYIQSLEDLSMFREYGMTLEEIVNDRGLTVVATNEIFDLELYENLDDRFVVYPQTEDPMAIAQEIVQLVRDIGINPRELAIVTSNLQVLMFLNEILWKDYATSMGNQEWVTYTYSVDWLKAKVSNYSAGTRYQAFLMNVARFNRGYAGTGVELTFDAIIPIMQWVNYIDVFKNEADDMTAYYKTDYHDVLPHCMFNNKLLS